MTNKMQSDPPNKMQQAAGKTPAACSQCGGSGYVKDKAGGQVACFACRGSGRAADAQKYSHK